MRPVRDFLDEQLAALVRTQPLTPGKVAFAWRLVAGAALHRATEVRLLEDGTLEVRAAAPQWTPELRRLAPDLLRGMTAVLGRDVVRRIRVR